MYINFNAACDKFGDSAVRDDTYRQKGSSPHFPVLARDGRIVSSVSLSATLANVPVVAVDFVFIAPEYRQEAARWLRENRETIIRPKEEEL